MEGPFDKNKIDVVVYHSPCNDGFGSAYLVWRYYRKNEFISMPTFIGYDYKQSTTFRRMLDACGGKNVLMVDVSFKRPEMIIFNDVCASLFVLDHHKSAKEELKGLDYAHFDMSKSGIMLTWDYFYEWNETLPAFLHYIGLRDIWQHETDPKANAFTAAFDAEEGFLTWLPYENIQLVDQTIERGNAILKYRQQKLEEMARGVTLHTIGDIPVAIINVGWPWTSELGALISKRYPTHMVMLWVRQIEQPYSISMRSHSACAGEDHTNCGPDVSAFCAKYGGGGHYHSAAMYNITVYPEAYFNLQ